MNDNTTIVNMQPPVKEMLTPAEEKLIALLAQFIADITLKQVYEKRNSVPAVQ